MKSIEATAVVLCGGQSKRMGFDKALLKIDHQYVLEKTCKMLQQIFTKILLVTDRKDKLPLLLQENYAVIEDEYYQQGPLGGLVTALHHIETPFLFLIACDIPKISLASICQLSENVQNHQVVLFDGEHLETLFAFYHKSCLPVFEQLLDENRGKIRAGFSCLKVKKIKNQQPLLKNVNYPNELNEWQ